MALAEGQLPCIYQSAVSRYQEITHEKLDWNILQGMRTVDELVQEIDTQNNAFREFREKRSKLFDSMRFALYPIETFSNMAAGAASFTFPPSSLVFGAVTYLTGAAQGVSASYDAIEDLMESLKAFTVRLKTYSQEEISAELSNKLSDILVTLMDIFALSTKEIRRGRLRRFGRNILLGNNDAISAAVAKLDKLTQGEAHLVQAETLTVSRKTGRTVDDVAVTVQATSTTVRETGLGVAQISVQMTEVQEKLGNLLASASEKPSAQIDMLRHILKPSQPDSAQSWYDQISKTRVLGTGEWIFTEDIFNAWVKQDTPIIFLSGIPGAGKSYLSASIITYLRDQQAQDSASQISIAFFFFKDDNPNTRSVLQALRDLAYQIAINDVAYQRHIRKIEDYAAISTLQAAWRRLFVDFFLTSSVRHNSVHIIFDGVDEAHDEERQVLFRMVKDIYNSAHPSSLCLAFVGRPHLGDQLYEGLEVEVPTIHITMRKNGADIDRYIIASIRKSIILKRVSSKLRQQIFDTLSSQAEGMFLWVNLMMQELVKRKSEASILKSLREAPRGLKEMVRHVLAGFSAMCEPEEISFLNELLLWTACSETPLNLRQAEDILRLISPAADGMIYLEGALRHRFASFFTLNRWDNLNTAELHVLATRLSAFNESDDRESNFFLEGDSEPFEDVENLTNFDSNVYDTTLTFCHASIGDFFRNENEGKVSAGENFTPVGVDWRQGKIHVLKTCLRLLTDEAFAGKCTEKDKDKNQMICYAASTLSHHLQSTPVSYATSEDQSHIASLLVKVFSHEKAMQIILFWAGWASTTANLQAVWKWWEDLRVLDTLDEKERNFISGRQDNPGTIFHLAAVCSWNNWLLSDKFRASTACRAIWSYQKMLKKEECDCFNDKIYPTVEEVLDAAQLQDSERGAFWYNRLADALAKFKYLDASLEYLRKALEITPQDPYSWAGMSWVYVQQENWHKGIEIFMQAERICMKILESSPNDQHTKGYLHSGLHSVRRAYANVGDWANELAASQRAFEVEPNCDECIKSIIFHQFMNCQHEENIAFLKRLSEISVPEEEYTQLTSSILTNSWHHSTFFECVSRSAFAAKSLPFMIDAWSAARSEAHRRSYTTDTAYLDMSLARIHYEYAHDETKAVAIWENVLHTFASTKEEGSLGWVKVTAANQLASLFLSRAIAAGVGKPAAEEHTTQLERLSRRMNQTIKYSSWEKSHAQSLALGVYYRLAGQRARSQALLKPVVKRGVAILSDDDPENDPEGLFGLLNAMKASGDISNLLAISYYIGNYDAYVEGKRWQPSEKTVYSCDGPCGISSPIFDGVSFCPICFEHDFCADCVALLQAEEFGINVCSATHVEYFIRVPPCPQKLEKDQMLVDGHVVGFAEWLENLKKEWNLVL